MFWGYQAHFGTQKNYATGTQGVRGSNPGLAFSISDIGYLVLPSRDMTIRLLKRRKKKIL